MQKIEKTRETLQSECPILASKGSSKLLTRSIFLPIFCTLVTVVSKNGTLYSGFISEELKTYRQAENMCRSKQARMLWFEMEQEALSKEGFTGPVWIQ